MGYTKPIRATIAKKLRDRAYRAAFFSAYARDEVACQIRAMREVRNMTQAALAAEAGMKQSAISRIEQADYSSWSFKTLLKIAEALDARLRVVFDRAEAVIEDVEFKEIQQNAVTLNQAEFVIQAPSSHAITKTFWNATQTINPIYAV